MIAEPISPERLNPSQMYVCHLRMHLLTETLDLAGGSVKRTRDFMFHLNGMSRFNSLPPIPTTGASYLDGLFPTSCKPPVSRSSNSEMAKSKPYHERSPRKGAIKMIIACQSLVGVCCTFS